MSFTPEWLALREQADAEARSVRLLDPLRKTLLNRTPLVIRDLGCGTGSMARWLAGRLAGPQHWVLHDRDRALLDLARSGMSAATADRVITVETRFGDLTSLRAADLAETSLVTASALLDLLTEREVTELAAACVGAGCPALLTLSVTGQVEFTPGEPLDTRFAEAFNAHQRRVVGGRRLLGPDAVPVAVRAFETFGASVRTRSSPWRLDARQAPLAREWLRGRVDAAVEQRPDLAEDAPAYLRRRLSGRPRVVIGHMDLLAVPGGSV
jgi:SAM-dependent methyltransferase